MGLVAYCVALVLERHAMDATMAIAFGIGLGLVLGMVNGVIVTVFRVPAIVATLGTLSIFRGLDFLIAGAHEVPVGGLPPGFTDPAHQSLLGIPIFVLVAVVAAAIGTIILRWSRFGRQLYAVGATRKPLTSSASPLDGSSSRPSPLAASLAVWPACCGSSSSASSMAPQRRVSFSRSWRLSSSAASTSSAAPGR